MGLLIERLNNGNVQLSDNSAIVQIFPPNCEVSQDLTNSKFVLISYQGKGIYSLSAVKTYTVRSNGVDTVFSNGTPDAFAALLLGTVFSLEYEPALALSNSFSTSHQSALVITPATGAVYFLKGLQALQDTVIDVTSMVGLVENGRKTAVYFATNIVLTTPIAGTALNPYIKELNGDAANAVVSYNRIQTVYVNAYTSWDTAVNKKISLSAGQICGVLAAPAQSLINFWAGINFEQL